MGEETEITTLKARNKTHILGRGSLAALTLIFILNPYPISQGT